MANPYHPKEPWEMTKEEWDAERERIRSSGQGEHRKSLYPHSANGARKQQAHFEWLTLGLPGQWMRFKEGSDESYRTTEAPKPGDQDFDVAFQAPISYEMVIEEAKRRKLIEDHNPFWPKKEREF